MGALHIEAVYENGVQKLPRQDGQVLTVTIQPPTSAAKRYCSCLPWTRDPEDLILYRSDPDESSWSSSEL